MPPLHRHQLARLSVQGWQDVLSQPWDADNAACLRHWAEHRLPLVVTVQPAPLRQAQVPLALGLPAPLAWQRRRIALKATPSQIAWFDEFPTLRQALPQRPRGEQAALEALQGALHGLGARARVYGSTGWQHLTGLRYLRDDSDLDLWVAVDDDAQADRVADLLQACRAPVRLDGELVFPHGDAVAWREWAAWRSGRCRSVLVKRLHGAVVRQAGQQLAAPWPLAA